jgi:hypothetical protein
MYVTLTGCNLQRSKERAIHVYKKFNLLIDSGNFLVKKINILKRYVLPKKCKFKNKQKHKRKESFCEVSINELFFSYLLCFVQRVLLCHILLRLDSSFGWNKHSQYTTKYFMFVYPKGTVGGEIFLAVPNYLEGWSTIWTVNHFDQKIFDILKGQ